MKAGQMLRGLNGGDRIGNRRRLGQRSVRLDPVRGL